MTTTPYKKLTYDDTKVQVESAIRDGEGVKISTKYAKKTEIQDGVLTIQTNGGSSLGTFSANQSTSSPVTITLPNGTVQYIDAKFHFSSNPDTSTNEEYPYRGVMVDDNGTQISISGITANTYAEAVYSDEQSTSLNYAPFIDTAANVIYVYSRTNVTPNASDVVVIPTISIGMDYSDITIDSAPTSGSGNAVSSGGVYTALSTKADSSALNSYVTLGTAQNITEQKNFKRDDQNIAISNPDIDGTNIPSSDKWATMLFNRYDDNTISSYRAYMGQVIRSSTGDGEIRLKCCNYNNTQSSTVVFTVKSDGTKYLLAPYRTSGITNDDVLTKGNLANALATKISYLWWSNSSESSTGQNWRNFTFTNKGMVDDASVVSSQTVSSVKFSKPGVAIVNYTIQGGGSTFGVCIFDGSTRWQSCVQYQGYSSKSATIWVNANTTLSFQVYGDISNVQNYNNVTFASITFIARG